jgi:hypothetical protein
MRNVGCSPPVLLQAGRGWGPTVSNVRVAVAVVAKSPMTTVLVVAATSPIEIWIEILVRAEEVSVRLTTIVKVDVAKFVTVRF